jgi:hypothetical protein
VARLVTLRLDDKVLLMPLAPMLAATPSTSTAVCATLRMLRSDFLSMSRGHQFDVEPLAVVVRRAADRSGDKNGSRAG